MFSLSLAAAAIVRSLCSGIPGADVVRLVDAYGVFWTRVEAFSGPGVNMETDCER